MADGGREQTKIRIHKDLLSKIVRGELAPGQRLREQELALAYKVSRTPIRDILIALEKDGLIEHVRNQGATVISFTADDLEQIYDVRCALECLAVRLAAPHLPLNQLLEFERGLGQSDGGDWWAWSKRQAEIDFELHQFIVAHAHNRRLARYLANASLLPDSLRSLAYEDEQHARRVCQEHLAIVRALLKRDAQSAEGLLRNHIETGKRKQLEIFCAQQAFRHAAAKTERPKPAQRADGNTEDLHAST